MILVVNQTVQHIIIIIIKPAEKITLHYLVFCSNKKKISYQNKNFIPSLFYGII